MAPTERYPLSWPNGWQRTPRHQRVAAQFSASDTRTEKRGEEYVKVRQVRRVTIADAFDRLDAELNRLGATNALVSSNLELRLNGAPRSNQTEPYENGIAVYFNLKGKPICLACEKWDRAADNIAAIAQHIDALRRIDRYGVGRMEQAFAGYTALPSAAGSWFVVLEFDAPPKSWATVEARYLALAKKHHPDAGGRTDTMAKINAAYDTARTEFSQ